VNKNIFKGIMFHASPHEFKFPVYDLLIKNTTNHDNSVLGLWVSSRTDWIGGFGENFYKVDIDARSIDRSVVELRQWAVENPNEPYFYTEQRQRLLLDEVDYIRVVESDGRSEMGIVLNFNAIMAFIHI